MHGNATQIQKHCVDFHREWLTTWNGASKLIATPPTKLLGLAGSGAVIDEPITLALGTYLHRYTPSRRWAYQSREGKYNRGQDIDVTTWLTLSYIKQLPMHEHAATVYPAPQLGPGGGCPGHRIPWGAWQRRHHCPPGLTAVRSHAHCAEGLPWVFSFLSVQQ